MYFVTFSLYLIILGLASLAGITTYFQKQSAVYLKFFPPFLICTLIMEVYARNLADQNINNNYLFNIYSIVSTEFYLFVLWHIISNRKIKKIIIYSCIFFFATGIVEFALYGITLLDELLYSLGSLLILFFCLYNIIERIKSPGADNLFRDPAYWIVMGLIIFYASAITIVGGNNLFVLLKFPTSIIFSLFAFLNVINCVFYSFFAIAFLYNLKFPKLKSKNSTI